MGIQKVAFNFMVKNRFGKEVVSMLRTQSLSKLPLSIEEFGLVHNKISIANPFSCTSYLRESFVKSLTAIKGKDPLDTLNKIKDLILRQKGYKYPESLKLETGSNLSGTSSKSNALASFSVFDGKLWLGDSFFNSSIEEQISFLYHELDHIDKFVRLYKAIGAKQYKSLILEAQRNSPIYAEAIKNGSIWGTEVNFDFYKNIAKDTKMGRFNIKKWKNAVKNYSCPTSKLMDTYNYLNNPLEISAYNIQSKINRIFRLPVETTKDEFPKNYSNIVSALKKRCITSAEQQDRIIKDAISISQINIIDHRLLLFMYKSSKGISLTREEIELSSKLCSDFSRKMENVTERSELIQKSALEVESFIKKGLLTKEKILDYLCSSVM